LGEDDCVFGAEGYARGGAGLPGVPGTGVGGLDDDGPALHRLQEDVDEGALELLVADGAFHDVVVGGTIGWLHPFGPDEQNSLVALAQVARVAADHVPAGVSMAALPPAAAMTRPVKRLVSPTKEATKALAGSS